MKKISIIVPVYNEEKTIGEIITRLKKIQIPLEKEIIVVNDNSSDMSLEIIKKFEGIKIISNEKNKGKGWSIRNALKYSTGDIVAIQDADLEYSPAEIPKLIEPILNKETLVVFGSRFLNKDNDIWKNPTHVIANILLSLLISILYGQKITDVETCYKIFTKEVNNAIRLTLDDFGFEIEVTSEILKNGFKIKELPIAYSPRSRQEGKKINWIDGIKAFWYVIKFKISKK